MFFISGNSQNPKKSLLIFNKAYYYIVYFHIAKVFYPQLTAGNMNSANKTTLSRESPARRSTASATSTRWPATWRQGGSAGARVMVGMWPAYRPSPLARRTTVSGWGSPGEDGCTTSPLQTSSELKYNCF